MWSKLSLHIWSKQEHRLAMHDIVTSTVAIQSPCYDYCISNNLLAIMHLNGFNKDFILLGVYSAITEHEQCNLMQLYG